MTEVAAPKDGKRRRSLLKPLLALLAGGLLLIVWIDLPYYRELHAFDVLRKLGGQVIAKTDDSWMARLNRHIHVDVRLLMGDSGIRDQDLDQLGNITEIVALDLAGTAVTDDGLKRSATASSLRRLQSLGLARTKISDQGMVHLGEFTQLLHLDLSETLVTDAALEHVKSMKSLESISLIGTAITDRGLVQLQSLPRLKTLRLDRTQITDDGLEVIAKIPLLEDLSLTHTAITDVGISHLKPAPKLETLELNRTNVTDAAFQSLQDIHNLEGVLLKDTRISQAAVDEFKRQRPQVTVQN